MALEKLRHDKMVTERAVRVALDMLSHDKSANFQYENAVIVSSRLINTALNSNILYSTVIQQYYTAMLHLLF